MGPKVYQWINQMWGAVFASRCVLCDAPAAPPGDLCKACTSELPKPGHTCPKCAAPVAIRSSQPCGQCLQQPPAYDSVWAPFRYAFPLDRLIQQFKFGDRLVYGSLLARLMLSNLQSLPERPETLVPVPLFVSRFRQRGFNQATELAIHLGRALDLPVARTLLLRTRDTPAQAGLDGKTRRANLNRAFAVKTSLQPSHVALVDDVMTTGSTAHRCAAALKMAGVKRVDVWVCARA